MTIQTKYNIGDTVYLKTDSDQYKRIITGIWITPTGYSYQISKGIETSQHYEMELSAEKDVISTFQ